MDDDQVRKALAQGSKNLGLQLDLWQVESLFGFLNLLAKWNRRFNLTGTKTIPELVHAHILDSLSLHSLVPEGDVLDVGTGAGFPGIPLAIARPAQRFFLLDSNGKKTRFLQQVKTELGLGNVMIHNARIEEFQPASLFQGVMSRAVSSVQELGRSVAPLMEHDGILLMMKGSEYPEELENPPVGLSLDRVETIAVPGKAVPRHIMIFHRVGAPESAARVSVKP